MTTRSFGLAVLIVLLSAACGRDPEPRNPTTVGVMVQPHETPPGVRATAARKFGPKTSVTYVRLTTDLYVIQGMKKEEVREYRVNFAGKRIKDDGEVMDEDEEEDEDDAEND